MGKSDSNTDVEENIVFPTYKEIEAAATQNAKDYWGHRDEDMERGFENGVQWLIKKLKDGRKRGNKKRP